MRDKVAMKLSKDLKVLQKKITKMIQQVTPELIKSITGYELHQKLFMSNLI